MDFNNKLNIYLYVHIKQQNRWYYMRVNKQPTSGDRIFVNYISHRLYGIAKKKKKWFAD